MTLLSLLITCIFYSCSKADGGNATEAPIFVNTFDIVGQVHNQGLTYVLQNFKKIGLEGKSIVDTAHTVFSLTVDFAKTIPFGSELNFQGCDFKTQWEKTYPRIANLENSDFKTSGIFLSDQQNKFIQEFKQVIKNSKLADSVLVFEEISELERRIWNSSMKTGEKYQLLLGTAVGKYSWKFWSQDDFSFPNIRTGSKDIDPEFPFDWDEFLVTLMEADMDGAIVGAIVGCIAGAIGGTAVMPGVGTITACVLESVYGAALGGIAASSYAAVKYLIKHFFGDDEAHH